MKLNNISFVLLLFFLCTFVYILQNTIQSSTLAVVRWSTGSENWFEPVTFAKFFPIESI